MKKNFVLKMQNNFVKCVKKRFHVKTFRVKNVVLTKFLEKFLKK